MRLHLRAVRLLPLLLPILLLPMGEAFGQELCPQGPTIVNGFPAPGSKIIEMAAVGSTLFLSVRDSANVYGLWKIEEGQAPERLVPTAWPTNVFSLSKLTAVGQRLFFVILSDPNDNLLWATDEAHTFISQVGTQAFPGNSVVELGELTVMGNSLYIRGNDGDGNLRLWWSDGTNVRAVTDEGGNAIDYPSKPVAMGGKLFFAAVDTPAGEELWVIDNAGVGGTARRLKDLRTGSQSSSPASLTVMGGKLYFTATTGQDASLWVSDGSEGGTVIVAGPDELGQSHGELKELTAVGDKLFFHMARTDTGDELWVSDGTRANTRYLEIQIGSGSSEPEKLTAVGRMLFFIARGATSGKEPWRSDGTVAGPRMVDEFYFGSEDSSETPELKAGPGVLLLSIFEDDTGKELWSISDTHIVRLTDIVPGVASSTPRFMTIAGDRLYFVAGPTGQDDLYWLPLNQVDCHAPSVTCPGPLNIEAVSPDGAFVFLPPPVQMSDDSFTPLTVDYSPGLFSRFGVDNSTPAIITVRDMAGNAETCQVTVNVEDTRGPELVCPANMTVEATGPDGANVSFPMEAWDAVSGVQSVSATRPSGSRFPLGSATDVTITAVDWKENTAPPCRFNVTVKDTQRPKLICPRDIVEVATSAEPIPVTYAPLQLEDATGISLLQSSSPSGSPFVQARTDVTLTATDSQNNSAECTFSVYIVDPVAPTITCPGPQQAVATGPEGAVVEFEASAEDALGPPTLRYTAEPGSTFPVGETTVTATATDSQGNEANCSFTVTVTDPGKEVPAPGCACRSGSASASVYWLLLALAPLWARRRIGRLAR